MAQPKSKKKSEDSFTFKHILRTLPFILIAAFLVFSPGLTNEFVNWDDYAYIVDNPLIRDLSVANITHLFNFKTEVVGNYHPLTVLSYAFEYKLVGLKPMLYHFDNIFIHLLNSALVCVLVWKLTKHYYSSVIACVLFAIHPMRVESVVWAAERKDVLYTFFFLISLLFYVRYLFAKQNKISIYILCILFFLFSILSKGQAVVLPLVLILIDYWYSGKIEIKKLIDKIPFFILSVAFGLLATKAQSSSLTAERMIHYELLDRIFFASYNLLAYPFKFLFPYQLACFYGYPLKSEMTLYYLALPSVLILLGFLAYKFKKDKRIVFSILFFLSTIFIVIQLLPIGNAIIADRYTYVPYIGFFILIGELLNRLIEKKPASKNTILIVLFIQLIVFAGQSFAQSRTWKSSETLWLQTLKVNPKEPIAHNNVGAYYYGIGQPEKAIPHFLTCIENSENYLEVFKAYNNLGGAYKNTNQFADALKAFNKAIELQPGYSEALFGKGLVLTDLKRYDESVNTFTFLLKTDSLNPNNYYSRAITYRFMNKLDSAIADYQSAIRIDPNYAQAYTNLGNIYFNLQNTPLAIDNYTKSLNIRAEGNTYLNRAKANFSVGNFKAAYDDYNNAVQNNASEPQFLEAIKAKLQTDS